MVGIRKHQVQVGIVQYRMRHRFQRALRANRDKSWRKYRPVRSRYFARSRPRPFRFVEDFEREEWFLNVLGERVVFRDIFSVGAGILMRKCSVNNSAMKISVRGRTGYSRCSRRCCCCHHRESLGECPTERGGAHFGAVQSKHQIKKSDESTDEFCLLFLFSFFFS